MAYDEDKDKTLASKVAHETETTKITIEIHRYKKGEPKIQIQRQNMSSKDWMFAKLGRVTFEEWEAIQETTDRLIRKFKKKERE